jgi:hypothetical protein
MEPIDRKEVVQKGGAENNGEHRDRTETILSICLTLPRFYRHLHKGENRETGGEHASKNPTSVYRGL